MRYLDDVFCLWTHGKEALHEFLCYLNSIHTTIKFTMEEMNDVQKLNFLDVEICKEGSKLTTDLYSKPVDTHQYLRSSSCHPAICKKSIPYGQALRLKRICSNGDVLNERLSDLKQWFLKRYYKDEYVDDQINRTNNISREALLKKRSKPDNEDTPITLVLPYHPALNKHVHTISKRAHVHLRKSPKLAHILPTPPRITYRNGKSLSQHLVRARMKPLVTLPKGVFPCKHPRCQIDEVLKTGDIFTNWNDSRSFKINHRFSCKSECVIYLLTCNVCNKKYVSSTIAPFNKRFNQYKSNINLYRQGKGGFLQEIVIAHFFPDGHTGSYKNIDV